MRADSTHHVRGAQVGLCPKMKNGSSFRGAAEGGEPGTHFPEACVHGFRAASLCSAPGMTILCKAPQPTGGDGLVVETVGSRAGLKLRNSRLYRALHGMAGPAY